MIIIVVWCLSLWEPLGDTCSAALGKALGRYNQVLPGQSEFLHLWQTSSRRAQWIVKPSGCHCTDALGGNYFYIYSVCFFHMFQLIILILRTLQCFFHIVSTYNLLILCNNRLLRLSKGCRPPLGAPPLSPTNGSLVMSKWVPKMASMRHKQFLRKWSPTHSFQISSRRQDYY